MNKFFKRLALVLVIVMALVMIPVSLAAADPLPADADPAVWDKISLTRADGNSLVKGTDYTVTKGKYSHYAYSEPFTYNIYNVTTSDPIVISGGAAYKNSSLTYPLKSRITLGADVTSVTLKDVTALGELSVTEGSNVDFTLAGENYVDKILGTGLTTTIKFGGEGSLTGEHIGGVDKYGADPATNVGCNIVINSGTFNITAGYKSAIGGGQYGNSGKITINGGNITAKSNYGAAIGGGQNGSATEIVITDGEINATGSFGAAIGGGQRGGAENISISGGTIEAKGSHVGAAIGGGQDGNVGTVEITDGDITVIARSIGIGGQDAENISISGGNIELKKLNSSSQEITADAGMIGAANGSTDAVEISGGSFNVELPEDYLAEGTEIKKNEDGTYGVKAASVAKIGTVEYASLDDAIKAAKDGDVIVVSAGEYKNGSLTYTGKAFTIKAADGAKVSFDMSAAVALHGAKITFEGVTFDYKTNGNYIGIQHADTLEYNNCTINGQVFLYATNETFNVCKFNQTSAGAYNVWTYGAKNVKFNGCVFNCVGKSVLLYNEGANTGTDLTVTDTTFKASAPVEGKAAIEIDTSLMGGQSKITVDKATADKTTGFAEGSHSGNTLWNDKKQTAETNKNTTVIVNGVTVFEPAIIDLDTFIKKLVASGYNFDGKLKNGGKLTVKWSPVTGCYDARTGHTCTVNNAKATGNTPKRVNSALTQFQLFEGTDVAVIIKNVKFVYEPAAFTVCENSGWKGSFTAEQAPAGQLYFMTTGDVTVDSCDFEKVVFTTFNTKGTSIVNGCTFKDVYNSYAIKDIRGEKVSVTGTTIENCGGGIMVSSTGAVSNVTITGNKFNNVDTAGTAASDKVGTRAILQIASSGKYENTAFVFSGNSATSCGPVIRQLNTTVAPVGSSLKYLTEGTNTASGLYTSDSKVTGYVEDENGNVTISTAEGLFWFAKQVNGGNNFAGKTVKLANDIDLKNELWTPIGIYNDSETHFKGTFDGQNHTVSGLKVVESGKKGVGFFGKAFTGTIKNLTVEGNITADGCDYVGGIVGHGYATITNCVFKGDITNNSGYQIGGIAGSGGFTITNCSVYGNIHGESWVGGIAGNVQDGGAYINCYVEGVISANSSYGGASAAGIAAIPLYKSQKINGCYSNTIVKCGDEEINAPIIGCYNGDNNITADTELFIHDNSWNKQKNPNDSYEVKESNTVIEGKTVSRDNNLIMLEDDLKYVEGDLSAVRIMAGSAVTQEQVDALAVAQIGDRKYTSLDTAIAAANAGETVKLLADVTEDVVITANKNITLDLGGKKLNGGTGNTKATITNYGTITITDSSAEKTGTIKRDDNGTEGETSFYVIRNFGTMTIEQANIINNSGYKKTNPSGSMVGSSLICNGDDDAYSAVLNIKGGTIRQDNFIAIKNGSSATLNVTGGKITSKHSAVQNWCNANITGGELNGQLWTDSWDSNSTGNTVMGGDAKFTGEIVIDITGSIVPKFKITGGTLDVTNWGITTAAANAGAKPAVSGGTFSSAVPEEYCAEGFIPTKNADGTYGVKKAMKGSKKNPYTLEELGAMTRADYIAAQKALGGTMYVKIVNYSYDKDGVLGNGVRNDTPGQTPDHSKLNSYGENGYLGAKNDGANGKNIIFVGGSITSGVEGYTSIDNIGTSLLLAVPAYTNVTFEGVTFNNVMSFNYQLYTSPWSQLGELKFSGCTFNGIIVGAIAAQTLTFDGCEFKNYTNKISANNSNPTWIRPAYGNWSKGDNDGQGSDFKSLTTINFTGNKVTSTRPVKFERIAQWEMETKVTVTGNKFDIKSDCSSKNVGLYFGANAKFDLVVDNNEKTDGTAALYTAVYKAPNGTDYEGLPAGSTVKNSNGADVEVAGVIWKSTDALTLKTTTEAVELVNSKGISVKFATLEEAFAAAKNGDTITLLSDVELSSTIVIKDVMNVTLDLNGKKLSTTTKTGDATRHYYAIDNYGKFTLRDSSAKQSGEIRARGIENLGTGTMTIESGKIVAIDANGGAAIWNNANLTINGGTFVAEHVGASSDQYGPGCVYNNGTLTINGGTFTSANKRTYAIVSKAGTVTITPADGKNVTISGAHGGLGIDGGTAIINGGSYASSDYYGLYVSNDAGTADVTVNGGTFTGKKYSVLIGSDGSSSVTSTLKIKGGTFDMPIHAQENTIDGAIAISGGKFKFKVDDKYFANGHVCSGTPGADGYYTIADHPIESFGVTIGEGLSLRLYVRDEYRNGKLLVKYTTVGSNPEVEYEAKISSVIEKVDGVATIRYCARIFGITPQMADVIIKVQYVDENDVAIGSEKEVSILKYCHNYVKEDSPEAVKTFVSKMLEYCASAMDYRMVTNEDQIYLGYTWKQRADALRAEKVDICGEDKVKYEFDLKKLGTYTNIGTTFKTRGMVYDNIIRIYFAIPSAEFNPGYKYYMNSNEIHPAYNEAKDQWEFSFTIAPYEYCNSIRITIKDGEDEIGEYACSLAIILESFSRKSGDAETDALAKLSVAAYEYCRSLADYPTSKDFNQ